MSCGRCRLALMLVLLPVFAFAQRATTGVVTGRIVDSSGGALPGVTVTLKSPEALGDFSAISDHEGVYRVGGLPPATYDIKAELQGFQSIQRQAMVRLNSVTERSEERRVGKECRSRW